MENKQSVRFVLEETSEGRYKLLDKRNSDHSDTPDVVARIYDLQAVFDYVGGVVSDCDHATGTDGKCN